MLATQEFWLTVEGDRQVGARQSAASPGRTGSRGRVGPRGCWRSKGQVSRGANRTAASAVLFAGVRLAPPDDGYCFVGDGNVSRVVVPMLLPLLMCGHVSDVVGHFPIDEQEQSDRRLASASGLSL